MTTNYLPADSLEIIELLDAEFPHKCIGKDESPEHAHRRSGNREVVEFLIQLRNKTERKQLKDQQSIGG